MNAGAWRATWRRGAVVLLALGAGAAFSGCLKEIPVDIPLITQPRLSDEEQIVSVLDDVNRGLKSRRIYRVLAHVSRTYRDDEGRDYAALQDYLNELFRNYKQIDVTRVRPRVIVQGDRARAVETFGTRAEPYNSNAYRPIDLHGQMNVYFEKIDGDWKIVEWGRIF
ncbi:MAG: hypothetical protein AMXMBFR4_29400 [Candidatus Hydrogenedentota bacterium]